jgi:mevalonate pyrophosphate decarboxylase
LADHPEEWEATETTPGINYIDADHWRKKTHYMERLKNAILKCRETEVSFRYYLVSFSFHTHISSSSSSSSSSASCVDMIIICLFVSFKQETRLNHCIDSLGT